MTQPILDTTEETNDLPALFEHDTRPQWGLAVRVDRRDRYDRFQFEDGELRKIAKGFQHLLTEVDKPANESMRLVTSLTKQAGLTVGRAAQKKEDRPLIEFDEQVRLFLDDFEEGFEAKKWLKKKRGEGKKRRLKRHRNAAIAQAQELLSDDQLAQLLIERRYDTVMARVSLLLDACDLVTKKDRRTLALLDDRGRREAANALSDIVSDEIPVGDALARWIKALAGARKGVSWSLATAVGALLRPDRHVYVKRTAMKEQARWMAPRLKLKTTPSGAQYERLVQMVDVVNKELVDRDLEPTDNFDVTDFIWSTLRPAARKRIAQLPEPPAESSVMMSSSSQGQANETTDDTDEDAAEAA